MLFVMKSVFLLLLDRRELVPACSLLEVSAEAKADSGGMSVSS